MERDVPWKKLGLIGRTWRLLAFPLPIAPAWETYWKEQREYWGADRTDWTRLENYFGKDDPEAALFAKAKNGFNDFLKYQKTWNGLCEIGETVSVNLIEPNVIALSKNWTGTVKDNSDLELWLREETTILFRRVRFYAEIYSFGTVVVFPGSIEAQMGERPGSSRIAHRKGRSSDRKETVALDEKAHTIAVADAIFEIVQ